MSSPTTPNAAAPETTGPGAVAVPRVGSLFSGYEGLGMAVQKVYGGELAWYSDVCKFGKDGSVGHYEPHRGPCRIMSHHYPDVPNLGDVSEVDWARVPRVDILTGGSPCQDLSHAGKRAGMTEGTRSNLWVAMREAIAVLRPSIVVWENVRGAASAEADSDLEPCPGCVGDRTEQPALRALGRVVGDLAELGYVGRFHGLRAADVEGCHGRFRYFLVAEDADGTARSERWLAGPSKAQGGRAWSDAGRPDREGPAHLRLLPTPAVNDMGEGKTVERWDDWTADMQAKHGNGNGHGKSLSIEAQRLAVPLLPTPRVKNNENRQAERYGGEDGNFYGLLHNPERWGDYAPAIARWERVMGRVAPEPTQTSAKGNPQLSARFVEWMMGLPEGWVTDVPGITRNEALKALGNGVVPQQAAAALEIMRSWSAVPA
ncbi:DNA cytosine methyltransferase [Pimelobacter simplex]|uniref:DNA cytosine methyltransferase n=1 Tax=Nocardioides simplex TaxID=2045 RepID=UPI00382B9BF6